MKTVQELKTIKKNTSGKVGAELTRTGGLLRLAPAWVPRSFLQPGLRLKLHPDDTYAYGANRGGIDERWFASTTEAASDASDETMPADPEPTWAPAALAVNERSAAATTATTMGRGMGTPDR